MANYAWSEKDLITQLSGSNPNRQTEHRYLLRTLWDSATINFVGFEWHNGAQTVKIRLVDYDTPQSVRQPFATGDKLWITEFGEYTVVDTDLNRNLWIDADFNEVAAIAYGTKIYRTRGWRVAEPGIDRYGNTDTTASINVTPAMSTLLQTDWEPTFTPSVKIAGRNSLRYLQITGSESAAEWNFDDNRFSGSVAFVSSDTSAIPFAVGDQVVIQQEQTAWNYVDNYFTGSKVAFTGSTNVPFPVDSQIYITGQTLQPGYNGLTSVFATASGLLTTWKPWLTDTAVDGGTIYGYAKPEYNRTATVINSFVSASMRWVVTDIPWAGNSVAIPGKMVSATNSKYTTWSPINTAQVTQLNRGTSEKEAGEYVIDYLGAHTQRFSCINATLPSTYLHPMQYTDSAYVLATPGIDWDGTQWRLQCYAYNAAGNIIYSAATQLFDPGTTPQTSIVFPIGLKDLETVTGNTLYSDAVTRYDIRLEDENGDVLTEALQYRISTDCIGLTPYCVMWEDSMGSVTSFPFNLVSQESTEIARSFWNPQPHQTEVLNTLSLDKWRLNSAFIRNKNEDLIIKDLLGATKVWLKTDTELIPVNVTNTEYGYGNREWSDLPNITLDLVRQIESVRK